MSALDDDVLSAVEDRTAGQVLSDLEREALTGQVVPEPSTTGRHGFRPFPRRGPMVTNELIDRLKEDDG